MKRTPPENMRDYHIELKSALEDTFLRSTLDGFSKRFQTNRANSYQGLDPKSMTSRVAEIKAHTARHVEELYVQFKAEAEKRGVIVHRAASANEANAIVARIARENAVKKIVKVKSMTCEETGLNQYLEAEGLQVTETDLGEWILQLRKEGPSHIVAPAIHLSREQVAELFTEVTGQQQTTDIGKLVKVARRELRRAFAEADMGVSGANCAVAENGTVALVTNEGNARMATTLPRVYVAVCGLDKLVDTMDNTMDLLRVVARNAMGLPLSAYVDWIDGVTDSAAAPDRKRVTHIVFLDNGRTAMMKDPVFSQITQCLRCGACANICPVYLLVGGHRMGHVYSGPIGLVLTYFFHGRDKVKALIHNCIGCERCKDICSGNIDLPRLIREIRARLNEENGAPLRDVMLGAVMKNRALFHAALRAAKLAQGPVTRGTPFVRHLPHALVPGQDVRALPALARKPFRDEFASVKQPVPQPRYRVALFAGCAQDFIYPEQLKAAVRLLGAHGVDVDFPAEQTCCGLPLVMLGQQETARDIASQNLHAFDPAGYDAIVTLCASCASHLKNGYPEMLEHGGEALRASLFADKIMDFSSFVRDRLGLGSEHFNKSAEKVAYHASCHLCRGLGVTDAPRELLASAAEYCSSDEEAVCCGFGGTYAMKFPEMSAEMLKRKLDNAEASGATRLVADCPGCIMQLRGGEEMRGNTLKVTHIAELLEAGMKTTG